MTRHRAPGPFGRRGQEPALGLAAGMRLAGLSYPDLLTRCLGLGGCSTIGALRRHIDGEECPDRTEHNLIALALNESLVERGHDHPVAYRRLYRLGDH